MVRKAATDPDHDRRGLPMDPPRSAPPGGGGAVVVARRCGVTSSQAGRIALWIAASPAYWMDSSRMTVPGPGAWIIMPFPE
ncbi:hypothetical protein GCM10010378_02590 [Streptomyces viridochromogenes]